MLVPVPGLSDNVLGFEAKGKVRGADYEEVMIPAVEAAVEGGGNIRMLYLLGDGFEGFTADAAWEDTKIGLHHGSSFERIALVTDHPVYRDAVKLFGHAMKSDVKVFATAELDAAKGWTAG
jgi:hypothetical protein